MKFDGSETYHVFIVTDPVTGDADYSACTELGDDINIQVSGGWFESDAYHLKDWAIENGFDYVHEQRRLRQ